MTDNLFLIIFAGVFLLALIIIVVSVIFSAKKSNLSDDEISWLETNGEKASATILQMTPGLTSGHTYIKVYFLLAVKPVNQPLFQAKVTQSVLFAHIPQIGDQITVLFDPNDHQKVLAQLPSAKDIAAFK